jgi:2-polyprenyl-6-methoxyphenol hydroxylase-like FAD-dependent oxidoreductase
MLRFRYSHLLLGSLSLLSLGVPGCVGQSPLPDNCAGHVNQAQALIAPVTGDHKVIASACESQAIARWRGSDLAEDGTFEVTNTAGVRLQAALTAEEPMHCSPIAWVEHAAWQRGRAVLIGDAAHASPP